MIHRKCDTHIGQLHACTFYVALTCFFCILQEYFIGVISIIILHSTVKPYNIVMIKLLKNPRFPDNILSTIIIAIVRLLHNELSLLFLITAELTVGRSTSSSGSHNVVVPVLQIVPIFFANSQHTLHT